VTAIPRSISDPCVLTPEQWKMLGDLALGRTQNDRPGDPYGRAAITGADGAYELVFIPESYTTALQPTALAPGYRPSSELSPPPVMRPGAVEEGPTVIDVPVIRLSKLGTREYRPTFVFEDENGPVTDPNKLQKVTVEIRAPDGVTRRIQGIHSPGDILQGGRFMAGIYYVEAVWDRRSYTFGPVDLTEARPATVTFRPQKIETADVIYAGRVVNGITGAPIAGAIIVHRWVGPTRDVSSLTAEQWDAIHSLGPQINATDPALAPLVALLGHPGNGADSGIRGITQTDSEGGFTLPAGIDVQSPMDQVLALAPGFLGAYQQLIDPASRGASSSGPRLRRMFEPDANGVVTFQPMKLFPAATVRIRPVVPDSGGDGKGPSIRLYWRTSAKDGPVWVKDLFARPVDTQGSTAFYQYDLQANITQTMYVPAGINLGLTLSVTAYPRTMFPPVYLKSVRLEQGQIEDLGRVEPSTGIELAVKVIDSRGQPVSGVRISCVDESGYAWGGALPTNEAGQTVAHVALNSTGRFCIVGLDPATRERVEQCVPYTVAGQEDAGKEFILQLPDEMVRLISGERR
jgi:hypothetical protein